MIKKTQLTQYDMKSFLDGLIKNGWSHYHFGESKDETGDMVELMQCSSFSVHPLLYLLRRAGQRVYIFCRYSSNEPELIRLFDVVFDSNAFINE